MVCIARNLMLVAADFILNFGHELDHFRGKFVHCFLHGKLIGNEA
jgi:hypothetical protein